MKLSFFVNPMNVPSIVILILIIIKTSYYHIISGDYTPSFTQKTSHHAIKKYKKKSRSNHFVKLAVFRQENKIKTI